MSYISKEQVKEIRNNLKKAFPEIKFSVRGKDYTEVQVTILESPYDFFNMINDYTPTNGMKKIWDKKPEKHHQVNQYHIDRNWIGKAKEILLKIYQLINKGNYDNSDSQRDHFDVGFYVSINIGEWDKPYIVNKDRESMIRKPIGKPQTVSDTRELAAVGR